MLLLLILFYNNLFAITGVRSSLALIIYIFALYEEFFRENKKIIYKNGKNILKLKINFNI